MNPTIVFFLLLSFSGCFSLYTTSSHQRWLARPFSSRPGRIAGAMLMAVSLFVLLQTMQPVAAAFFALTWVMLVFVLLPYLGALLRRSPAPRATGTRGHAQPVTGSPTAAKRPLPAIRRDWFSKTLAGTLLGFSLALGCSGLFSFVFRDLAMGPRAQLAMWLVTPIWMSILGGCFLFRSGARAWLWLGGANLFTAGSLWLAYSS